jgi:hypothetical protein
VRLPDVRLLRRNDTHRLIPSRYSDGGDSVLAEIVDNDGDLQAVFALDNATNDRLVAEAGLATGIGIDELVFGLPYARIVNAAFCHPHPLGGRFNGPDRGVWYAAFELATAQAEVAFHRWVALSEVGWTEDEATWDDYLADFGGAFHDIRGDDRFADCVAPDSYVASQELADALLEAGSLGIVYTSARRKGGTCLACFGPALVGNVRKDATWLFRWEGKAVPTIVRQENV